MRFISHRTDAADFFGCPICDKKPYIHVFNDGLASAKCKGDFLQRHKKVWATACRNIATIDNSDERRKTIEELRDNWNRIGFKQIRFLFYPNGKPYWER